MAKKKKEIIEKLFLYQEYVMTIVGDQEIPVLTDVFFEESTDNIII